MVTVYLGLGSNMGNRQLNIEKAYKYLSENPGIKISKTSSLYLTSAIGPKQRDYINSVARIETKLAPIALLKELKKIELKMGRKKYKKRWMPRIIDIDILFYGAKTIAEKALTVPHKEIEKRKFVLTPLCELSPRFRHPVLKISVTKLLGNLAKDDGQKVRKIK